MPCYQILFGTKILQHPIPHFHAYLALIPIVMTTIRIREPEDTSEEALYQVSHHLETIWAINNQALGHCASRTLL